MKQKHCIFLLLLLLVYGTITMAQPNKPKGTILKGAVDVQQQDSENNAPVLDAQREKAALLILLKSVQTQIVSAAEAMPAVKYSFAPTEGEFKGVRTFGQQVKHLAATNHILAAAALGEEPPADAGDEEGPESIRTKSEILDYLNASFAHLGKAIDAIGDSSAMVKSSPISPLPANKTTCLALTVEALIHTFDHYGQMVEYLRMNGVVPPASRP
ncbi:MAG TPA: DinB family protein [Terriglobales bacterium]